MRYFIAETLSLIPISPHVYSHWKTVLLKLGIIVEGAGMGCSRHHKAHWGQNPSCIPLDTDDFSIIWFHCPVSQTSTMLAGTSKHPLPAGEKGQGTQIPAPDISNRLGSIRALAWCPCPSRSPWGWQTAGSLETQWEGSSSREDVTNSMAGMQINPLFSSY